MFAFILFLAFADAALLFSNTTTSTFSTVSSPATTSPPAALPTASEVQGWLSCDPVIQYCNRSGYPCYYGLGELRTANFWSYQAQTETGSAASSDLMCASIWDSSLTEWLITAPVTLVYTAAGAAQSSTFYDVDVEMSTTNTATYLPHPAETPMYYVSTFNYTPATPCCSSCTIFGGTAQVYYWPTPAPSPPVSTLVDASNFTFISPSIYVAFSSLYATNLCGTVGSKLFSATTIAFAENDLSTAISYTYIPQGVMPILPTTFEAATYGQSESCVDITSSFYQAAFYSSIFTDAAAASSYLPYDVFTVYDVDHDFSIAVMTMGYGIVTSTLVGLYTVTYNSCSPFLSVPTRLFDISSLWAGCVPSISAFFDPPYVLSTGNGMSAFGVAVSSTEPPAPLTTPKNAAAGSTPAQVVPSQTTPPILQTSTANADPPASPASDPPTIVQSPTTVNNHPATSPNNDPPATSVNNDPQATSLNNDPPPQSSTPVVLTLGSSTITANPSSAFVIGSQTLAPGSQITVSGTVLSLFSDANSIAIGGSTTQILASPLAASPLPAILTFGGSTITANSASAFAIGSQTLIPGSQITASGTVLSLASNGKSVVIGGSTTQTLASATNSDYLIGSQTLIPGGPAVTISGTAFSLLPGGSSVVVGGSTQALSALLTSTPEYEVGSETLVAGAPGITISGIIVSLESGGASVVIGGSKTEALSLLLGSSTTTLGGLGAIIQTIGGFGAETSSVSVVPYGGNGTGYNGTMFFGEAGRVGGERSVWMVASLLGIAVVGVGWL